MRSWPLSFLTLVLGGCSVQGVSSDPVQAPFLVSDYFVPSGYMGDGSVLGRTPAPIEVSYSDCAPRPAGARGNCYRFVYTPVPTSEEGKGWAGVYWQGPANNWGQEPPQSVTPNATRVAFYAATETDGDAVSFLVGGLNATDPDGAPLPYVDKLSATQGEILTTGMTRYEIPLPSSASYDAVVGAFGWSISAFGGTSHTLYLDDIQWLTNP